MTNRKSRVFFFITLFFITLSLSLPAAADYSYWQIHYGAGTQTNNGNPDQDNTVLGLDYLFKSYSLNASESVNLNLGLGVYQLSTDQGDNRTLNVVSIIPQLQYQFQRFFIADRGWQPFLALSIAPSFMDEDTLGFSDQGGRFIFNDVLALGTYIGRKRKVSVQLQWRHLSNGGIYDDNPGIDVPIGLAFGWRL